jgi:hypothetical protein
MPASLPAVSSGSPSSISAIGGIEAQVACTLYRDLLLGGLPDALEGSVAGLVDARLDSQDAGGRHVDHLHDPAFELPADPDLLAVFHDLDFLHVGRKRYVQQLAQRHRDCGITVIIG